MKKFFWILRAYLYMHKRAGWAGWARWDVCESLYETYAIEWEMSPQDGVDEDMSYWGG
jgi:hypothetical protein